MDLTEQHVMNRCIVEHYDRRINADTTVEYYDHSGFFNCGYWDEHTSNPKEASVNLMEKLLAFIPDKSGNILDVACGKGATTMHLLNYYAPGNVTGLNLAASQLAIAQRNAPGCSFAASDAANLCFENASFDNIICVEAAFHFYTRERFLREAHRVLKPGGRLVLSDILTTLEGEKMNKTRTDLNYVADLDEYRAIFTGVGFTEVAVVDVTESCWQRHFLHVVEYFHLKLLAREIDRRELEAYLSNTYYRADQIRYYALAAGTRM